MDRIYRGQRHVYDLTRKYYLFGRDRLIDDLDVGAGGTVLEVGCGTGRNLIRAARCWPQARFHGIDISDAMLATARSKVDAAGLSNRILLAQGDAAAFDPHALFGIARFDRVIFSYTLSMIPPWQQALQQGIAATAPDGRISIVDFGGQTGWPALWRTPFLAWLKRFDVTPRLDLHDEVERLAALHDRQPRLASLWRDYARTAML